MTDPPGAKVYLGQKYLGRSPLTTELEDGFGAPASYVRIEKEGYETQSSPLRQHYAGGYIFLDVLLCIPSFLLGCGLIYFNGKKHDKEYNFLLEPLQEGSVVQEVGQPSVVPPPSDDEPVIESSSQPQ